MTARKAASLVSGRLEVTVDDERRILDPGDAYYFERPPAASVSLRRWQAVRSDLGLHAADVLSGESVQTKKARPRPGL